ncbi:UNVERIFIED_CONTAM: hypothetical protein FKN15_041593 [Acipenser sinensis]
MLLVCLQGRQSSSQLLFDVHYWIGSQSSQDEQGAAAILVTQLDNYLGGSPIQYREVQDCESVKFKSYFKNGIVYKKGGLASGFKHVETNMYNIKRLLHVKGRKNFSATEVDVSWNSFNVGDIFLLDMGKVIVQWNGPESNHPERLKGRQSSSQLLFDVHYWIGSQSSQDEQGAAAILVTQLDNYLGGSPIQYREVQDCESVKFKSYFKNGIVYKKGGLASGFKHVETNMYNIKRLLHVKGRKNFSATEVDVSWNSFNVGDIFLLDMGKVIVQWNGPESNHPERLKGMMLSQDIRDRERGGRAQIGVVDGDNEAASPELMKIMTAVLGQRTGTLKPATPDNRPDLYQKSNVRLYQCVLQTRLHFRLYTLGFCTSDTASLPTLHTGDCYIVDQGGVKIFVWKGKNATTQERQAALGRAEGFIKAKNYPSTTNVEIMNEDAESSMFKQLFKTWTEKGLTQGLGKTHAVGRIAKVDQVKFDVMELHARPDLAARERMVDDGSGKVEVWRIEELELKEVDPSTYGQFYGGDCYLVLYTYSRGQKPHYILYMWQGLQASQDEITASAYQAVNLDNKYNGEPVQVRVTMTKEPRHFLAIFKGKLIIYQGCSGDERERAKNVADIVSKRDKQTILEGQEPADFWVALGGKAPYCSDKRFQEEKPQRVPRLFECSNQTGRFMMTEVFDFAQEDLDEEDVMLLDTWEEIFLWIGKAANDVEKKESLTSAAEYLKTHPAQRDPGTPVTTVTQGHEPLTFTGWFSAWDPHKWSHSVAYQKYLRAFVIQDSRSYEDIKNSLGDASAISQITVDLNKTDLNRGKGGASKSPASGYSAPGGPSTPLNTATKNKPHSVRTDKTDGRSPAAASGRTTGYDPELLVNKTAEELPEGVDPSRKEVEKPELSQTALVQGSWSWGTLCLLVFNPGPGEPCVCWFSILGPGSPVSAGFQPRSGEPCVCWFSAPVWGALCLLVFSPGLGSPVSAGFQPRSGEPCVCWFSAPVWGALCLLVFSPGLGSPVSAGFQPRSGEPCVCWFSAPVWGALCLLVFSPGLGSPVSAGFQPRSGEPCVCWFSAPVWGALCLLVFSPGLGSPVSAGFQPRSGEPCVCWFSAPVWGALCLLVFSPGLGSPVSAGFQPWSWGALCLLVFSPGLGSPVSAGFHSS